MSQPLQPGSVSELSEIVRVRSGPRLIAVGAGSKPTLSAVDALKICTTHLSGISEYDPSEFTITAQAGTTVREIVAVLAERGQYLPFDPFLLQAGATLGGTVAAGLSGPGRVRFGGLRDFILGVRFVDGVGRVLRVGGKVVKNAAGFDLPKFFVGSLGRFGILVELTFKVFPRPSTSLTLQLDAPTLEAGVQVLTETANSRFEFDALDLAPNRVGVLARLTAPHPALAALSQAVLTRWPGRILHESEAEATWTILREFAWSPLESPLIKLPLSPNSIAALISYLDSSGGAKIHVSAGGNVAYISLPTSDLIEGLDKLLRASGLSGLALRGANRLWLGRESHPEISRAIKVALDPEQRFPSLDESCYTPSPPKN